MTWVFLAITTYFLWALVNIGDKFLIANRVKDPFVYAVVGFLAGNIGLLAWPFLDFVIPSFKVIGLMALSALGFFVGVFLYLKAMQKEEVSRIAILFNFLAVITLVFAWMFIGDKLSFNQLIAFILLFVGSIISSLHFGSTGKIRISKALILILLSCVCYAVYDVIIRYATVSGQINFASAYIFLNLFLLFYSFTFFLSKKFRILWIEHTRNIFTTKLVLAVIGIAFCSRFGVLLHTKAISLGPVALINAMEGFQSIIVFILAILLSYFAPKYIKEELDRKNIILKLIALVFMIVGVVVLNLG